MAQITKRIASLLLALALLTAVLPAAAAELPQEAPVSGTEQMLPGTEAPESAPESTVAEAPPEGPSAASQPQSQPENAPPESEAPASVPAESAPASPPEAPESALPESTPPESEAPQSEAPAAVQAEDEAPAAPDLAALAALARQDGAAAAAAVNAIADAAQHEAAQHEAALKAVLDVYHTEALPAQLAAFTAAADERAAPWLAAYARAAAQRADASLPYKAGSILVTAEAGDEAALLASAAEGAAVQAVETPARQELALIELPLWQTVEEALADYAQRPGVVAVQPEFRYTRPQPLAGNESITRDQQVSQYVNDTHLDKQWYLDQINLAPAWSLLAQTTGQKQLVAVIDSGVNPEHSDLKGVVDESLSRSFGTDGSIGAFWYAGSNYHATHVAGTIGAKTNDGQGVAGVGSGIDNQVLSIVSLNVFSQAEPDETTTSAVVAALNYAVSIGCRVVNMSLGSAGEDAAFAAAVAAVAAADVAMVVSAGNNGTDAPYQPSDFPGVISVIASNTIDQKATFSNYGSAKWISAPGVNIFNCYVDSNGTLGWRAEEGTSMAAPIVTGVVAMIRYVNPSYTVHQIKDILANTAVDTYTPGFDVLSGYGRIDAGTAVGAAVAGYIFGTSLTLNQQNITVQRGETEQLVADVQPANATYRRVQFISEKPSIAEVDASTGVVTGISAGKTVITARCGALTAKCNVTVISEPRSLRLNMLEKTLTAPGKTVKLKAIIDPPSVTNKTIRWASSNKKVATVNTKTGLVKATGYGSCTITARTVNNKKATCKIRVGGTPVARLKATGKASRSLKAGRTLTLKVSVLPENATNQKVVWSSADPNIARVNSKGKVKALKPGTVKITATSRDGGKKRVFTLRVR